MSAIDRPFDGRLVEPADRGARPQLRPPSVRLRDQVRIAADGLRARRLRSVLTALGIAIGIAAMVAVLAISESSRASLLATLDRLGTNLLTVAPGRTLGGDDAALPDEAAGMIRRIGPVSAVAGVEQLSTTVRRTDLISESETGGIGVYAADLELVETLELTLRDGTFLNAATARYPAVVLGHVAAERLGIDSLDEPVSVWLGDGWYVVVGILEPAPLTPEIERGALVGGAVAEALLGGDGSPTTIYVRAEPDVVDDVASVLAATANPENPEEIQVNRPSDALEARAAASTAFTALLLGLGSVALLVGGLGIANVMLMAVLERRSEIGLRRALGATRRHIAGQFMTEAGLLAGVGGALGVCLGIGVAVAYASSQGWPATAPVVALVGGPLGAVAIGMLAGLYPALRAAVIPPTEALRSA